MSVATDHKVTISYTRRIFSYDVAAVCTCGWSDQLNTSEFMFQTVAKAKEELRYRRTDHLDEMRVLFNQPGRPNYYTVYIQPALKLYNLFAK